MKSQHYFWNIFGKKKKGKVRKGAIDPDQVRNKMKFYSPDQVIEITRVGYDGQIDDMPLMVKIVEITDEYFTGQVINPERNMIEQATSQKIYAKKGGGLVQFYYEDGDIYDISMSNDESVLEEAKNVDELKDLIQAIDVDDPILICYWDKNSGGTINAHGRLVEKSENNVTFKVVLDSINNIELETKQNLDFNLEQDTVIDIQYAG